MDPPGERKRQLHCPASGQTSLCPPSRIWHSALSQKTLAGWLQPSHPGTPNGSKWTTCHSPAWLRKHSDPCFGRPLESEVNSQTLANGIWSLLRHSTWDTALDRGCSNPRKRKMRLSVSTHSPQQRKRYVPFWVWWATKNVLCLTSTL